MATREEKIEILLRSLKSKSLEVKALERDILTLTLEKEIETYYPDVVPMETVLVSASGKTKYVLADFETILAQNIKNGSVRYANLFGYKLRLSDGLPSKQLVFLNNFLTVEEK